MYMYCRACFGFFGFVYDLVFVFLYLTFSLGILIVTVFSLVLPLLSSWFFFVVFVCISLHLLVLLVNYCCFILLYFLVLLCAVVLCCLLWNTVLYCTLLFLNLHVYTEKQAGTKFKIFYFCHFTGNKLS